jgi:hypothetical protein
VRSGVARRAATAFAHDIDAFGQLGHRQLERSRALEAVLSAPRGRPDLVLRMVPEGRFFGGDWGLEVSTAEPLLPATPLGLTARGRGVVRRQGVSFKAKGADPAARRLAELLSADERLGEALGRVDFETLAVRPDGRPAIRHLGGSVVWVLLPPIVRATPLPRGQAEAMTHALDVFAAAGQDVRRTDLSSV